MTPTRNAISQRLSVLESQATTNANEIMQTLAAMREEVKMDREKARETANADRETAREKANADRARWNADFAKRQAEREEIIAKCSAKLAAPTLTEKLNATLATFQKAMVDATSLKNGAMHKVVEDATSDSTSLIVNDISSSDRK